MTPPRRSGGRSAATSGGRASRSRPRSRSSPSAPAGGRSSRRSGCRRAPDNPAVIADRAPRAARARSSTATAAGSPAASATRTARRCASTATTRSATSSATRRASTGPRASSAPTTPSSSGSSGRTRSAGCWTSSTPRRTIAARPPDDARPPAPARGRRRRSATDHGAVVMLDPTTGDVLALASTPIYDAARDRGPGHGRARRSTRCATTTSDPLLPRATLGRYVPGSVFKIVTGDRGPGHAAGSRPTTTFEQQPQAEDDGPARRGLPDPRRPPPADRRHGARPHRRDRGQLQHLVRAGRARRRAATDLVDGAAELGFGDADPVRPADGRQPGDRRRRRRAGRLQRRRRARVGVVRPGRDVRHAAPDGARGVDRRERRRADAPAPGARADGRGPGDADDPTLDWRRVLAAADAQAVQAAMQAGGRGRPRAGSSRPGRRCRGVPTAGKSGTAELGGSGEPHSWFIGFAPVENPKVAIAVLVEQGGRGGERAAPLAGLSLLRALLRRCTVRP